MPKRPLSASGNTAMIRLATTRNAIYANTLASLIERDLIHEDFTFTKKGLQWLIDRDVRPIYGLRSTSERTRTGNGPGCW